jgi:hypothetical protein
VEYLAASVSLATSDDMTIGAAYLVNSRSASRDSRTILDEFVYNCHSTVSNPIDVRGSGPYHSDCVAPRLEDGAPVPSRSLLQSWASKWLVAEYEHARTSYGMPHLAEGRRYYAVSWSWQALNYRNNPVIERTGIRELLWRSEIRSAWAALAGLAIRLHRLDHITLLDVVG